jgi:cobalt-zinc-cadmium efflux system outer membrane protein
LVCVALLLSGCRTPPLQSIDESVAAFVSHPFDVTPAPSLKPVEAPRPAEGVAPASDAPGQDGPRPLPPPDGASRPFGEETATDPKPVGAPPRPGGEASGTATPSQGAPGSKTPPGDVVRTAFTQVDGARPGQAAPPLSKFELMIPKAIPGAETPLVKVPSEPAERAEAVSRLFPKLPPLPEEPVPLPGPDGRPYTLADFQRIAAANNPALRQAASDVEAARGLLIQALLYPNPTIGYATSPNANNTASTTLGFFIDQVIKTGGKLTLAGATQQMSLVTAELALKRARFDLATTIRSDFYTLVVAKETVRVNKALAHFTDEIFRLQADLLAGGFAGGHEPAALRSQAFVVRLAYQQAIANYVYAWKQLVADMGLKQLPLSAVEGQVDRLIPYYDYDAILAYILRNHTDILTARYNLQGARYSLKLAQVTPMPDVEVNGSLWKEHQVFPLQNYYQITVGIPLPIFDRNQGNIRAASAALVRAAEGQHTAEVSLTTGLATAYATYKTNLAAIEYYRRNILPDQVRYYRGVFERRKVDPSVAFGDLVQAQQVLVADVTTYLGVLGTLWTSVVNVANFLQTDDMYQLGTPLELPQLPDFDALHPWPCPHDKVACPPAEVRPAPTPVPIAAATIPPTATTPGTLGQRIANPTATWAASLLAPTTDPGQSAGDPERRSPFLGPPLGASISVTTLQEYFANFLGVPERLFGAQNSGTVPPSVQPSEPFAPDLSRRSSAASSRSSS